MLLSAIDHYQREQAITAAAVAQLRSDRFGSLETLTRTMVAFQVLAAREATAAIPRMLDEQNLDAPLAAMPRPEALAGYASDGRPMSGLLDYTRNPAVTDQAFALIVATQLQDVARNAASIVMGARPRINGYVRMLNTPSCSRCAVLAGRFYRWSDGFQRHPKCDCRHVPTTRDAGKQIVTEPRDYFASLSEAEQDRIFTKAGAQAIRDGADVSRVVNARRGMSTAQRVEKVGPAAQGETVYLLGKPIYTPPVASTASTVSEGATRLARDADGLFTTTEATSSRAARARLSTTGPRLMPESIYEIADGDRAEAIRLLRANGYIT